ncbi:MAG: DNA replication/repair protein RecF [Gemmobacter sp.]
MVGGLTDLHLSRFRSHRAARLVFDGRPVAFWGANGAGKTNILEAVSLLSPGRGLRRAGAEELAQRPDGPGWKIAAVIAGHEVETFAEAGAPRQVRINGKAAAQAALGRVARVLWLTPAMDRLWIEAAEGRRRFLDRMVLSLFPGHAEAALAYEKAMRERNRLLRDGIGDPAWFAALERRMGEAGAAIVAARAAAVARIGAAQDAGAGFPVAGLRLVDPEPVPGDAGGLAVALAAGRGRDAAAGRTLVGPHRADLEAVYLAKGAAAAQCSTGEQKAMLISLVLANARVLAAEDGATPILLLDEVAAHLDAGRRAALYDAICAMGVQALMTGTEAGLFDALGARAQRFEVAEAGGASAITEVGQ